MASVTTRTVSIAVFHLEREDTEVSQSRVGVRANVTHITEAGALGAGILTTDLIFARET